MVSPLLFRIVWGYGKGEVRLPPCTYYRLPTRRRMYDCSQTRRALAHHLRRLGQRHPGPRATRRIRTSLVRRPGRGPWRTLDNREPAAGILHRARLLSLARRTCCGYPLHRLRPPWYELPAALPAGVALLVLAPPPP